MQTYLVMVIPRYITSGHYISTIRKNIIVIVKINYKHKYSTYKHGDNKPRIKVEVYKV
jgi:hypothetical protein